MAPADRKPCVYADTGCTWTRPHHDLIVTRAETEAYVRTHSSKCLHNPMMRESRGCARDQEETNKQRLAETELRRENAQQEKTATYEPTRRKHQGQQTFEKDLTEKYRQGQGAITKKLLKGSCQGQRLAN